MKLQTSLFFLLSLATALSATADRTARPSGEVNISVSRFEELLEAARAKPTEEPDEPPPIDAALEGLLVQARVQGDHADVTAEVTVRSLAEKWVTVPLLCRETAVASVTVDGQPATLGEEDDRYVLHLEKPGEHRLRIEYSAPVESLVGGHRLSFCVPRAVSGKAVVELPHGDWRVHVLPATGIDVTQSKGGSTVEAVLARTDRVQVLWGGRGQSESVFTRSSYALEVVGEGIFVDASFDVEVSADEPMDVPLIPSAYALSEVTVDGEPARVVASGNQHAVTLSGHGRREIRASFALVLDRDDGQPAVQLDIPPAAISRFEVVIPGERTVSVEPVVPLRVESDDATTRIIAHVPRVQRVRFGWTDSRPVPEQDVRMNGEGFLAVAAEQGALRVSGRFKFDVISGKAREIRFRLPESVVIYEVTGDGVSDWRPFTDEEGQRQLAVYLDQPRHGSYQLDVSYDSLLRKSDDVSNRPISIPVIEPQPVHRYQGVILLLAGEALEFQPAEADGFASIGEESLPQDVKGRLVAKVAHGFKYVGESPPLTATLDEPRKEPARFDVRMNTLLTLDEGALHGRASADVTVKSGDLKELVFEVDESMTVLEVVAPALLKFAETQDDGRKIVTASFTEAMAGTFRVGLTFERILDREIRELELLPIQVRAADVQRGHLALESPAALEVESLRLTSIQEIGVDELPKNLVTGTKNPILLAYKYTHLPYALAIRVTRHESLSPIDSRIIEASINTAIKEQGDSLTHVQYRVTNQSRQFLRIEMPEVEELWPVHVGGQAVRPARDQDGALIVPLPRADAPFEVALTYAVKQPPLGNLGRIGQVAPRPDLFVEMLYWHVELPAGFSYVDLDTNLSGQEMNAGLGLALHRQFLTPADDAPRFTVRYLARSGRLGIDVLAALLSLGTCGLLLRARRAPSVAERVLVVALALGLVAIVVFAQASPLALLLPALAVVLVAYFRAAGKAPTAEPA